MSCDVSCDMLCDVSCDVSCEVLCYVLCEVSCDVSFDVFFLLVKFKAQSSLGLKKSKTNGSQSSKSPKVSASKGDSSLLMLK